MPMLNSFIYDLKSSSNLGNEVASLHHIIDVLRRMLKQLQEYHMDLLNLDGFHISAFHQNRNPISMSHVSVPYHL
jgi:hypothetical protein